MELHTDRRVIRIILVAFALSYLIFGELAMREWSDPVAHFLDLLLHDRVVQLIMIDFFFFFVWVVFWMIDYGRRERRRVLYWIPLGAIAATLMITLFLLFSVPKGARAHRL